MQLSCLPVSFFEEIIQGKMSVAEWARMGSEIGLDAVDLSILFVPDKSTTAVKKLRQEIEAFGIRVAMVTTYSDFTHPDQLQRERELELEQEAVMVAAELGAEFVRVTAGQAHPETRRKDGVRWAIEGIKELIKTTRDANVTLVYENHGKPGAWEYADFSQPPDIFLEIVHGTTDLDLGINFDTGNAAAYHDDPVALLQQVIDRVVSVHAADTAVQGQLLHVLLGTGITPFTELFHSLKQVGWDGWICMEEASFQGREGVEAASHFIRDAWKAA